MGIADILIAVAMLVFGIVKTARGELDRGFMVVWIGILLVIIAQFVWVTFSKKGTVGVLLPTKDDDR